MVSLVWHRMMSSSRAKTHGSEGASGMSTLRTALTHATLAQAENRRLDLFADKTSTLPS